jgi:hypothetical protein
MHLEYIVVICDRSLHPSLQPLLARLAIFVVFLLDIFEDLPGHSVFLRRREINI